MSSEDLHAPRDRLRQQTLHMHQAIVTLIEELEAVDWYQQRADDCDDAALKDILLHNMREEVEHASMTLEWIRRNSDEFGRQLRTYLFTAGPVTEVEEDAEADQTGDPGAIGPEHRGGGTAVAPRFTIGPLKGG